MFLLMDVKKMSTLMMNILNKCFLKPSKLVCKFSDIRTKSLHLGQCLDAEWMNNRYLKK